MKTLLASSAIVIAAQSPHFIRNLLKTRGVWQKYSKEKISSTFQNLRRQGFLEIEYRGNQIYIHLTKEGKKKAGMLQIDSLEIKKPKKWDRKWRVVIFDISQLKKVYRESFRGKIKELGFYCLQKSVWVHPFNCEAEIDILKDFFGLSEDELRLMIVENLGEDLKLQQIFQLT